MTKRTFDRALGVLLREYGRDVLRDVEREVRARRDEAELLREASRYDARMPDAEHRARMLKLAAVRYTIAAMRAAGTPAGGVRPVEDLLRSLEGSER